MREAVYGDIFQRKFDKYPLSEKDSENRSLYQLIWENPRGIVHIAKMCKSHLDENVKFLENQGSLFWPIQEYKKGNEIENWR